MTNYTINQIVVNLLWKIEVLWDISFFLNYIQNVHTKLYKVKYIAIDVY